LITVRFIKFKKSKERSFMGKKWAITRRLFVMAALALLLTAACAGAPAAEKLIVATNAEFPPFEFITEQGGGVIGEYDGIDVMLIQALAAELGMEAEISNMDFEAIIPAVVSGKAVLGVAGMTVTEERLASVDFSVPYWVAVQSIIVPADSAIAGVDDLQGKKVGVITGFTGDLTLSAIGGIDLQHYKKGVDAVMDLNNGRVEAVVVDSPTAHKLIANYENLRAIDNDPVFETESYAICAAKGNEEFMAKLNAALQKLIDNGDIDSFAAEVDSRL
jgi:polar amino acid transport system substrate-binding protein